MITVTLHTAFAGTLWQGCEGRGGWNAYDLTSHRARICDSTNPLYRATLRDVVDHVIMGNGGDFQNAMLCADSYIEVSSGRRIGGSKVSSTTRYWDISAFPSIADLVDSDAFSNDFSEEE